MRMGNADGSSGPNVGRRLPFRLSPGRAPGALEPGRQGRAPAGVEGLREGGRVGRAAQGPPGSRVCIKPAWCLQS